MRAFVQRLIQLVLVLLLVTLFTSFLIDAGARGCHVHPGTGRHPAAA